MTKSEFKIGQSVELNGKEYKIVGTQARSFLLERDGKTYKATADKLSSIQNRPQFEAGQVVSNGGLTFTVGEIVTLEGGKQYAIAGVHARSFLLSRDGKTYKMSVDNLLSRIMGREMSVALGGNKPDSAPVPSTKTPLQRRVDHIRLFNQEIQYPKTAAECAYWFDVLRCNLEPESLHCDGEASASQVAASKREIMACWRELEMIVGRKVEV